MSGNLEYVSYLQLIYKCQECFAILLIHTDGLLYSALHAMHYKSLLPSDNESLISINLKLKNNIK